MDLPSILLGFFSLAPFGSSGSLVKVKLAAVTGLPILHGEWPVTMLRRSAPPSSFGCIVGFLGRVDMVLAEHLAFDSGLAASCAQAGRFGFRVSCLTE